MKKILKSRIFLVIITIILSVGTTVCGAILYNANQVSYTPSDTNWNVSSVDEALNDLYNTANTKLNSTTAEAGDILSGKTAYSRGNLVTGTMENRGAVNATINPGASYTIPAGYHNGSGTVTANDSGSSVYYLGTGTSFDIKSKFPSNYASLTANNFIVEGTSVSSSASQSSLSWAISSYSGSATARINKSYNASTGILTCNIQSSVSASVSGNNNGSRNGSNTASCKAYLILGDIGTI